MTAPSFPRVLARGGKRACKVCKAPRELVVRPYRAQGARTAIRFAGYCATCSNHVGAVAASKVDEADQVLLELALDEINPEQRQMFAGAQAPRARGDAS
jgi:hypothetical protein